MLVNDILVVIISHIFMSLFRHSLINYGATLIMRKSEGFAVLKIHLLEPLTIVIITALSQTKRKAVRILSTPYILETNHSPFIIIIFLLKVEV